MPCCYRTMLPQHGSVATLSEVVRCGTGLAHHHALKSLKFLQRSLWRDLGHWSEAEIHNQSNIESEKMDWALPMLHGRQFFARNGLLCSMVHETVRRRVGQAPAATLCKAYPRAENPTHHWPPCLLLEEHQHHLTLLLQAAIPSHPLARFQQTCA
jgi:hypothetical protein